MTFYWPDIPSSSQRYDIAKSYEWNYANAPPLPTDYVFAPTERPWRLCGVEVNSPVAIAAGPLLNGRWLLHYAAMGFDVLTYKTVRSRARECYPVPNLQPITPTELATSGSTVQAVDDMQGAWAVSFGMPSTSPDLWRFDVEETRRLLPRRKKLSVSVVASPEPDWSIEEVAEDYARCARWAAESGADFVELNFSCPNVSSCDGQLYQQPGVAKIVADCVRRQVPDTPILLKLGLVESLGDAKELVDAVTGIADGLVMINCISAAVRNESNPMFSGEPRGIAGDAIQTAVKNQLAMFRSEIGAANSNLEIVGVGGIASAKDAEACLKLGASGVQVATSVMT